MLEVGTRGRMSFRPEAESKEQLPSTYRPAPVGHCITKVSRSGRLTELDKYAEYESIGMAGIELRRLKSTGEGKIMSICLQ